MKNILLYLLFIFTLNACTSSNSESSDKNTATNNNFELVWQDEFNYTGLPDSTLWKYDTEGNSAGWGNNEEQYYTIANKENAWVENGTLKITAHHKNFKGKEFTSARLISIADWKFGRVEINAKIPDARGTWSALWMMPGNWTFNDGNWPDIGEIDIMEHVGHNLGVVHASAHSKDYQWQKQSQKTAIISVPNVEEDFHSYILEWDSILMKVFVDDSLYFEYKNEGLGETKWPYNKPFYLIMNIAVGGAWGNVEGINADAFPQTMEIDYVRVYQKPLK